MRPTSRSYPSRSLDVRERATPPRAVAALSLALLAALPAPAPASHACTLTGTPAGEELLGTPGPDVICGLGGNDLLRGLGGDDILEGGAGDDVLDGGEGADAATYETAPAGEAVDLTAGTAAGGDGADALSSIERVTGSAFDDVLRGGPVPETLDGAAGTDLLDGGGGADLLLGGEDEDHLLGAAEAQVDGGPGTDACPRPPGGAPGLSCLEPSPDDPDDVRGFLDVRRVDASMGPVLVWRVSAFGRWRTRRMRDRGFAIVEIDTFGLDVPDYHVIVRSTGGRLRAVLMRNRRVLSRVAVRRPSRSSLEVRVPLDRLVAGGPRAYLRWDVVTLTAGCRRQCLDRVPDEGQLVAPLP